VIWRDFKPLHISKAIWENYIQNVMWEHFMQRSYSGAKNQNKEIHGSITTQTSGSILFVLHAKRKVKFFFITSICF
jgi:hypothetical protein